jgi:regulatory protein
VIDHVIEKLVQLGYLDDAAFVERFARAKLMHKSHGPRRIHADLRRLGVPATIIDDQLKDVATAGEIRDAAARAGSKYWRRVSGESDPRRQRWRFVQYLVRRGFDFENANAAFEVVAAENRSE